LSGLHLQRSERRRVDGARERVLMLDQTKAMTSADLPKEFEMILVRVAGFNERVKVIDAELARLGDNDALAPLVADLTPLTRKHVVTFTLLAENRAAVRAPLDALRVSDRGKLRRLLRSLLEVGLLPWEGTGKPNAETAWQRVQGGQV
jgi:hypothetical protein